MKGIAIFGLVVIAAFIILLVFFGLWVRKLQKPTPGRNCKENSDWVWDDSCLYLQEKFYDSSLQSPKDLFPSLTGFTYSKGAGASIFLPCWYRFRYVNVKTGGYSDFSAWSKSPVISGSCCLPCPGGVGQCPSTIKQGYNSCSFNQPTIGIDQTTVQYTPTQMQPDGGFIYMNLHRYVGTDPADNTPPPADATDEIVGYLLPTSYVGNTAYYSWIDVMYNPCNKGCNMPTWCQSNTPCSGSCSSS